MKNLSIIILLLTLAALGCKLPSVFESANSETNGAANGAAPAADNPAAAPTDDPRNDVIRASKKFLDQPQFSASMQGEGGTPMNVELDYQAPDRFHMKYLEAGGGIRNEMMVIGRDMYMKHGQNWQKLPGAGGNSIPNMRQYFDDKGLDSLKNVNYVGAESLDGKKAYVYSYRNEAKKDGAPYPFTSKIWVRSEDGLPQKIEVDYEGGDLRTVTIEYDYEKNVSIEPPVKK